MHLPPNIALILTFGFVFWLLRRDLNQKPNVTGALWLPVFWLFLILSRLPSQWLSVLGVPIIGRSVEEGNPIDAMIYFGVIVAGLYVLNQRRVNLTVLASYNAWITFYLVFCFIAIAWSDFPFVAFKRWIKILGHPVMVLIILSEPDAEQALVTLMKRTAYVIIPFSVLFIKYFEDLGRNYDEWTGAPFNTGITIDKNALGYDCLILGCFFVWYFLKVRKIPPTPARRTELILIVGFLYMIWWLLSMAHSSTSLISLVVAILVLLFLGLPFVNAGNAGRWMVAAVLLVVICELSFGVSAMVISLLGKDPTLTGRTKIWSELFDFHTNPIVGTGFESFWLGERLQIMSDRHWWHPNEAHNGYLEIYLNLGAVGLLLLAGLLIVTFKRGCRELSTNFEFGRFRLGFLAAIVVYNWTESAFKGLHPMWFVFYIIAMEFPKVELAPAQAPSYADSEEDSENEAVAS